MIAREAMARGFTVAALDSVKHLDPNATNYQWSEDETANNPDVANTKEMVAQLQDPNGLNAVDANKPVVVFGFSNGGSMASRVAQHLNIASAAIYISNAAGFYVEEAIIPPLVLLPGQNDPGKALSTNTSLADTIEKDGGTVLLHINPPQSLTPGLFMRIPSVDCTLSKSIGNAFGRRFARRFTHAQEQPQERQQLGQASPGRSKGSSSSNRRRTERALRGAQPKQRRQRDRVRILENARAEVSASHKGGAPCRRGTRLGIHAPADARRPRSREDEVCSSSRAASCSSMAARSPFAEYSRNALQAR